MTVSAERKVANWEMDKIQLQLATTQMPLAKLSETIFCHKMNYVLLMISLILKCYCFHSILLDWREKDSQPTPLALSGSQNHPFSMKTYAWLSRKKSMLNSHGEAVRESPH